MSRDPIPGSLRRLARERGRLAALGLLAVTALASSGLQAGAVAALRTTLDAQWRGTYDVLVTSVDAPTPVEGLLPPNALGAAGGLTLEDVERVRAVDGVEVAAPIGEIAVPSLEFAQPLLAIPAGLAGVTEGARAFRFTIEYTTDDGLGERVVDTEQFDIVAEGSLGATVAEQVPGCDATNSAIDDVKIDDASLYPALSAWLCRSRTPGNGVYQAYDGSSWGFQDEVAPGVLAFGFQDAPQSVSRIVLVDPVAERELLGESAGFLDVLIDLAPSSETGTADMRAWAENDGGPQARDFLAEQEKIAAAALGYPPDVVDDLRRLYAANGKDWDAIAAPGYGTTYLPLVVAATSPASLGARVTVEDFGPATRLDGDGSTFGGGFAYAWPDGMTPDAEGTPVGTSVVDLSALLNPFIDAQPTIAWPGADDAVVDAVPGYNTLNVFGVGRVTTAPYTVTDDGVVLAAAGYRDPRASVVMTNSFDLDADPVVPGVESAYAGVEAFRPTANQGIGVVPVGTFSTEGLTVDDSAANYVPLGAYQEMDSRITEGSLAGTVIAPSVTGLGIDSPRTVAIGSLASATDWGPGSLVSAIRVRVAGIDGYTTAAQEKVVQVAAEIERLGFRATVVAGSSPAPQQVRVLDYAFGNPAGDPQVVGELGVVDQSWSELGAAARSELSLSAAALAGLLVALAAALVLLGAVQLAGIPARRVQAGTLRELGFTRGRTARWYLAEEIPALAAFAAVGLVALLISGWSTLSVRSIGAAGSAAVVLSAVAVVLGSIPSGARRSRRRRSNRRGAASVAAFGARQVVLNPLGSVLHLLGIALVGLSGGALAAAMLEGREGSGRSVLARLLSDTLLVPQLALAGVGIVSGIVLVVLVRRIDLRRRAVQWETLHAAGWTSRQLARAQRVEGALVVIPAVLVALSLAWVAASLLAPGLPGWLVASVAGGAAALTAGVSLGATREGGRR